MKGSTPAGTQRINPDRQRRKKRCIELDIGMKQLRRLERKERQSDVNAAFYLGMITTKRVR